MNTIILVEDEQPVRDLLVEFLQDLGYQVRPFETADLAWEHIRARQYQVRLLITDLCLPGDMDGLDLVKRLHAKAPDTPVIVVSGFHQQADSLRGDDIHWLGKPFSFQRLETLCREIISPELPLSVSSFCDSES
jgi:DNA-binding NtrC family response regulator